MNDVKARRIISCILFIVLLFGILAICSDILEYKEARIKYTPFFESDTNFDVIFLGASHVWNHVLPMEMWKDYGIASYNWGYSNCTPAENYYIIQDVLNYTSPKVVVMDAFGIIEYEYYGNGKYMEGKIEQQHVQFDSFPIWSVSKYKASRDVFDNYEGKNDFIWNFIMYHKRWNELSSNDFHYDITTEKGSCFMTGLGTGSYYPIGEDKKTEINSVCYPYFLKIIELCQSQGIQVLCTYLPYGACSKESQLVANSIGDIVESYSNCSYVNMLTKDVIDYKTDICPDDYHLNYSGALKVTTWLGQYLKDNYSLDDYSDNPSWQNDYDAYEDYKKETLKDQTTLAAYLVQLSDDDFQAEVEIYDPDVVNSERIMMLFDNASIAPTYVENGDSDKCVRLVIRDSSQAVIADVNFTYDRNEFLMYTLDSDENA